MSLANCPRKSPANFKQCRKSMKHLKLDRRCDNFSSFTKMSVASHDAARNRFLLCIMQWKTRENREHKKEQQKTSMSDKQRKYPRGLSSSALYFAFSSCSFCLPSAAAVAACLPASIARTEIFSAALAKKAKLPMSSRSFVVVSRNVALRIYCV